MLELGNFDAHNNTTTSIIIMLDYLELDIELSNNNIKTIRSNKYREMLGDNGNTLVIM